MTKDFKKLKGNLSNLGFSWTPITSMEFTQMWYLHFLHNLDWIRSLRPHLGDCQATHILATVMVVYSWSPKIWPLDTSITMQVYWYIWGNPVVAKDPRLPCSYDSPWPLETTRDKLYTICCNNLRHIHRHTIRGFQLFCIVTAIEKRQQNLESEEDTLPITLVILYAHRWGKEKRLDDAKKPSKRFVWKKPLSTDYNIVLMTDNRYDHLANRWQGCMKLQYQTPISYLKSYNTGWPTSGQEANIHEEAT